jgi:hypothetical protein
MAQEFRYAANIGGEDRCARSQRFDNDHRLTFKPQRREGQGPERRKSLQHCPVLHRTREPDSGHAHRLKRFALRTVANDKELAVVHPGEPPSFQEPMDAFFSCQPPNVSDLM